MENSKRNLIVVMADKNFVNQAKQLFSSIYHNSGWRGDYLLITNDIPEIELESFKNKGILIYKYDNITEGAVGTYNHPPIVLAKLVIFQEYFKQWDKVIFLDADIIVRASLDNLLRLEGFNAPFAPSVMLDQLLKGDCILLRDQFVNTDQKLYEELANEYNLDSFAFNTGLMVFDTKLINTNTYSDLVNIYHKYGKLNRYGEEATINLYFYHKWNDISIFYSALPSVMKIIYNLDGYHFKSIITHYVGTTKPWEKASYSYTEWQNNLRKFDSINLENRLNAVKLYSDREINDYLFYLRNKHIKDIFIIKLRYYLNTYTSKIHRNLYKIFPKFKKIIYKIWNP